MNPMILLGIAASVASPAAAAVESQAAPGRNPDRIICRSEQIVGTRLAKKQRCMKASEWSEMKRLAREVTEKVQVRDEKSN